MTSKMPVQPKSNQISYGENAIPECTATSFYLYSRDCWSIIYIWLLLGSLVIKSSGNSTDARKAWNLTEHQRNSQIRLQIISGLLEFWRDQVSADRLQQDNSLSFRIDDTLLLPWDADGLKTSCDRSTCHKQQARCMMGYKLRVSGVQGAVARSHKPTNKPPRSCQSDETAHSNEKWPFHRIIWLYTHSEFTGFLFEENIMILMTSTCLHDFAFWLKAVESNILDI